MGDDNATTVLRDLLEPGAFGGNPPHWQDAMSAMPARESDFPDVAALPGKRAAAGLPAERDAPLRDLATEVAGDPALRRYAWYLHWRTFVVPERGPAWGAPSLLSRLGERAGLLYELLALEFPERLAAWHRRLGYPDSVTTETVKQVAGFEGNHLRGRGCAGIYESQFVWLATYLVNPYVRLGRFEYALSDHYGVGAWRHARLGAVMALADAGTRVDDDGLRLPADAPEGIGWTTRLDETADEVVGFPIVPSGHILRTSVRLARADWTPCLRKGTTVLDLHIPAGGGMSWEAVTDSMARALDFFSRHHPDRPFAALVCSTWFLDPRLQVLLPPDANIARLQRAVYLVPSVPNLGGLWFLFLRDMAAVLPSDLPRDTALRKVVAEFMDQGGHWHGGSMFLMRDHMGDLREGRYEAGLKRIAAL